MMMMMLMLMMMLLTMMMLLMVMMLRVWKEEPSVESEGFEQVTANEWFPR